MSELRAMSPPFLDPIVKTCLAKDPEDRWQSVGDIGRQLQVVMAGGTRVEPAASSPPDSTVARWQRPVPLVLMTAVVVAIAAILVMWPLTQREGAAPDLMHFAIIPPDDAPLPRSTGLFGRLAILPDGSEVIYRDRDFRDPQLYRRPIGQDDVLKLPGASGVDPFVSPDGAWIGFQNGGALYRVSMLGGPPVRITQLSAGMLGASWGADDQIIFGSYSSGGLFRVSAGGGEPEALTIPETGEETHSWPDIVPGGEAVLFVAATGSARASGQLAVLSLDTRTVKPLGLEGFSPRYVPTGHLVFVSAESSLMAVPFDVTRLEVTGNAVALVEDVVVSSTGRADFSISDTGTLVYVPATGGAQRSLVWVDRNGREEPIAAPPRAYIYARLAPDGSQVALDVRDQEDDIWIYNLVSEGLTRLTLDPAEDVYPSWTPDGQRIIFTSRRHGGRGKIYSKAADGTGGAQRMVEGDGDQWVNAVTPDGARVVFRGVLPGQRTDLQTASLDGDGVAEPLLGTEFTETNAALSPDGRWLAYESDQSGRQEVYVHPFPNVDAGKSQVSTDGGVKPLWAPDGDELFYLSGNRMMTVSIHTDPDFSHGSPESLFAADYYFGEQGRNYDVGADERFLMIKDTTPLGPGRIDVVLNWHEELKARVPVD